MILAPSKEDPAGVVPGLKEARTIEGKPCNRLDETRFEIVGSNTVLIRV